MLIMNHHLESYPFYALPFLLLTFGDILLFRTKYIAKNTVPRAIVPDSTEATAMITVTT